MPKYLIPVVKRFASVTRHDPGMFNGTYYQSPVTPKSTRELIERSGCNTGNFLFIESLTRHVGHENVTHWVDVAHRGTGYIRENYDMVLVTSSNFVNPRSSGFLENFLVSKLKEWRLPFLFIGLGSQVDIDEPLPPSLVACLRYISENSTSIGVRGA